MTIDVSTGGFSTLLSRAPSLGEEVRYSLRMPAAEPLAGQCRVTDVKAQTGNVRVSFQFVGLSAGDRERIEVFVFDTVLAQLVGVGARPALTAPPPRGPCGTASGVRAHVPSAR